MKKLITLFLTAFLALTVMVFPASAAGEIKVVLDGKEISFDQPPVIVNDRTMVPMRAIFEALGAEVDWNEETRTATGSKCGIYIDFQIDEPYMLKNTINIELDAPATLINGRTMLPVRAVAESFGVEVSWEAETRTVYMKDLENLNTIYLNDGSIYFGESIAEIPHGYGSWVFTEKESVQIGLWEHGVLKQGIGKLLLPNGDYYNGEFKNDKMDGHGEYIWADGERYNGNYKENMMHGYGEYYWEDGSYFAGNYAEDKWDGYGEYHGADGETYKGYFKNDKKDGYGEAHYNDGGFYKGYFKEGRYNGYGELNYPDGTYFKGNFKDGELHGSVEMHIAETGETVTVTFENGELLNNSITNSGESTQQKSGYDEENSQLLQWVTDQIKIIEDETEEIYQNVLRNEIKKAYKKYNIDIDNLDSETVSSYAYANAERQVNAMIDTGIFHNTAKTVSNEYYLEQMEQLAKFAEEKQNKLKEIYGIKN